MNQLRFLLGLLLFATLSATSRAGERTYVFGTESQMDAAGAGFRRAVNAWQNAAGGPSINWMPVEAPPAARVPLGADMTLMLVEIVNVGGENAVRLLLLAQKDAPTATIREGETDTLGPLEVKVVRISSAANGQTLLLMRRVAGIEYLADTTSPRSTPKIGGDVESHILTVRSDVEEELLFADAFMAQTMKGLDAGDASRAAFEAVPPFASRPKAEESAAWESAQVAPGGEEPMLGNATVTVRSITGESSALQELSSSLAYRSDGRKGSGSVGVRGGGDGADVRYGGRGDRISGRLHALEASGRVNVDSEATTLVNVGGETRMAISGPGGAFDVIIGATPAGRNALLLDIDLIERNGGSGSARRQRVRVANGGTIQLSGFNSSRTETRSSGAPIASGLPYVGPLFGSSSSSKQSTTSALFVTLEMN